MMNRFCIFLLSLFIFKTVQAQQTQTIRGTIVDKQSQYPLMGASVILFNSDPLKGTIADENGKFRLEEVPVGRQSLKITYIGYKEIVLTNVVVNSGKEVILNIEMEEEILSGKEVVITDKKNKGAANNELVTISGRSFSIDETQRYAGSLGDPSRMASNFAGVSGGGSDQRNDIVIRGNSPLGLLWRLEGADIPNPNHFSNQGANGGPVSILNNNTLANSDFLTGAWPAEYGNANSGVFDLKMRNGNNEKREYTAQIGFNGFELMAEGPFKKGGASYLISYRYSTLAAFTAMGFSFGESGVPFFQDLTFKFSFPRTKLGTFNLFGIGGKSHTAIIDSKLDSSERAERIRPQDLSFRSAMGVTGLSHLVQINKKSYVKTVFSVSGEQNRTLVDTLHDLATDGKTLFFSSDSRSLRYSLHSYYNRKINAKHTLKTGFILTRYHTRMSDSTYDWRVGGYRVDYDFDESAWLGQAYINWYFKPATRWTINSGVHFNYLFLNNTYSPEPRLGAKYELNTSSSLSAGYGLHGQAQPLPVYFEPSLIGGQTVYTNKDLAFTKSHHFVLGYEKLFGRNLRFKSEVYYQYLTNVPVTSYPSVYSVINFGADFGGLPNIDSLESTGVANNYGIEFTFERFFNKGYYYLATASIYQSEYLASDGQWRNTAFNGNFVFNVLGGKEFTFKKGSVLSFNIKAVYAGGRREIPINETQSKLENRWVQDESRAYAERLPAYFRTDFRIGFKQNKKKFTQEIALDLQNVFNIQNILTRQYNPVSGKVENVYQIGMFPVPLYRIQF